MEKKPVYRIELPVGPDALGTDDIQELQHEAHLSGTSVRRLCTRVLKQHVYSMKAKKEILRG
jgi:hypothetical protein